MNFSQIKTDIIFTTIFKNIMNKNIIINFLNNILDRKEDEIIVDVVINDPHDFPEEIDSTSIFIDLQCVDQKGRNYNIVIPSLSTYDYPELYQSDRAEELQNQLKERSISGKSNQIICIGFLDFNFFENDDYITHYWILNKKTYQQSFQNIEICLIELNKFKKTFENSTTISDQWIYFLKHVDHVDVLPNNINSPDILEAFNIVNKENCPLLHERTLGEECLEKNCLNSNKYQGRLKRKNDSFNQRFTEMINREKQKFNND